MTALSQTTRRRSNASSRAVIADETVLTELDLTQEDFATLLGVSLATVRKWERGTGEPSGAAKTLLAVARLHPEAIRVALAVEK